MEDGILPLVADRDPARRSLKGATSWNRSRQSRGLTRSKMLRHWVRRGA